MFVVKWLTPSGDAGWHEVDDVQAAIAHVEHLRNRDGVDDAGIFRLEQVAFEFKPYYRVELAEAAPAPAVSFAASIAPDPVPAPVPEPAPEPEPLLEHVAASAEPVAAVWSSEPGAETDANGAHRRGLFGR